MARILIFGDSITWGAVDPEGMGWANRLQKYLYSKSDRDISVYNLGISGDTTEGLLKRFRVECEARKIDESLKIIFAIGTNDSRYINTKETPEVTEEKFVENLEWLINVAREFTDKIVFIGLISVDESKTSPIPWSPTKHYTSENISKYDSAIKSVCDKQNLPFMDMSGVISNERMPDGLHPDAEGHRKIFEKVKDELDKLGYTS